MRQERRRQEVITWPRATAVLTGEEDYLEVYGTDPEGLPLFYHAHLMQDYIFYARGERQTGNRIAPEFERLNAKEGKLLMRELGLHRRYEVVYNPENPADNYLTVGPQLLSNWQLLLYGIVGLLVPGLILQGSDLPVLAGTLVPGMLLLVVLYFLLQPILDLRAYLQPTPEEQTDDLLEGVSAHRPPSKPLASLRVRRNA